MAKAEFPPLDLDGAFLDPASWFRRPEDVLAREDLGRGEKTEILCRWAYDATSLAVAEEEGMQGGEATDLAGVISALLALTGGFDVERTSPTKHAGFCARR